MKKYKSLIIGAIVAVSLLFAYGGTACAKKAVQQDSMIVKEGNSTVIIDWNNDENTIHVKCTAGGTAFCPITKPAPTYPA